MSFFTSIEEFLESGDPIVRSWPLVHSLWTPFICSSFYVFFVKRLGPFIMHNRQPFDLRHLMVAYNFSIVSVYTFCLITISYHFFPSEDGYEKFCTPSFVIEGHYTYKCASVGWGIYIVKYVEFADTVFFVIRKKFHLITNLHVVHHAALPIISWILIRTETSGIQFIPAVINSVVHIVMYTYYGLAAMGPDVQKKLWWKEYLTLIQMLQFVVIILFLLIIVPLSGCKTSTHGIYMNIFFATLFLLLFYNFYTKTYKKSIRGVLRPKANIANGVQEEKKLRDG